MACQTQKIQSHTNTNNTVWAIRKLKIRRRSPVAGLLILEVNICKADWFSLYSQELRVRLSKWDRSLDEYLWLNKRKQSWRYSYCENTGRWKDVMLLGC